MIFVKNGIEINTPYIIEVEGVEVELTYEQLRKIGYRTKEEIINEQNKVLESTFNINEAKINMVENIEFTVPVGARRDGDSITLPFKLGYKWVPSLNNGIVTYSLVQDPKALGVETNPIYYTMGVKLVPNAFYIIESEKYVYVGKEGYVGEYGDGMVDMELWGNVEENTETEPIISDSWNEGKIEANSQDNPYIFASGVELIPNCYYIYNDVVYVYMGSRKVAEDFESVSEDMIEW